MDFRICKIQSLKNGVLELYQCRRRILHLYTHFVWPKSYKKLVDKVKCGGESLGIFGEIGEYQLSLTTKTQILIFGLYLDNCGGIAFRTRVEHSRHLITRALSGKCGF